MNQDLKLKEIKDIQNIQMKKIYIIIVNIYQQIVIQVIIFQLLQNLLLNQLLIMMMMIFPLLIKIINLLKVIVEDL